MDNRAKAEIIVQFTQDQFNSGDYDEFFDYNDLGVPMSIAIDQDMVILTDKGEELLEETWKELCLLFNANPDSEYESIDDLTTQ